MAFWKNNSTPEPLRAYRWYIQFTNQQPSFKNIKFALKECKKPEFEINVTEHKRLNHVTRLPGILKWKPITVKFASIRGRDISLDASSIIYSAIKKGGYSNPVSFLEGALSKYSMHNALEKGALNIIQVDADGKNIEAWSLFNAVITNVNFGTLNYDSDDIVNIECTITYDYAELNNQQRLQSLKIDETAIQHENVVGLAKAERKFGIDGKDTTQGGDLKPLDFYYPEDPKWTGSIKKENLIFSTEPVKPDKEYDIIPPDKFDKAIKLVTAKDANDLGRLIKISRTDNRAKSRDLSGQYNEFKDATDGDSGLIFSDTIKDINRKPINTEEQIRNEQFAKEEAARQAARSKAEEEQLKVLEEETQKAAKAAEEEIKKLEWQRLTAEQDAKDASSNKDNLASNIPVARSKAEQEAEKLTYDLEAEATKSGGSDFNVEEMMASESAAKQKEDDAVAAAQAAKEAETQARVEQSFAKAEELFGLAEQSENTKSQEEIERKDLKDESARLYAEEKIARDDAASVNAQETLNSIQQIADDTNETVSEKSTLYPQLDESGNVAGTINYQENNQFINENQQIEYGPEAPSEQEWAQMNADKTKRETPNLLGNLDNGKSASEAFEGVSVQEETTPLETGPKGNSSGEVAKAGSIKSTSKIDSAYDDDTIGSSGPKIESYKDESLSSSNKYDEATISTVAGAKYQVKERVESIEDIEKIDARLRELNRQTLEASKTKDYNTISAYQERAKYERELLKARKSELEKKKN